MHELRLTRFFAEDTAGGPGHPQLAECERGVAGDWCARPAGHDGECNPTRKLPRPPEVGRLPWPHGADPTTDAWLRSQGLNPDAVAAEVREHIDTLIRRTGGDDRG